LREVREETGVVANVVGYTGRMEFKTKEGKPGIAKLYLMEEFFTDPEDEKLENREKDWLPYAEADNNLTHIESKSLLKAAEALRLRRCNRKES
jgi:ADP-ribose pyrophosphatase YjhB (NUDIX family)